MLLLIVAALTSFSNGQAPSTPSLKETIKTRCENWLVKNPVKLPDGFPRDMLCGAFWNVLNEAVRDSKPTCEIPKNTARDIADAASVITTSKKQTLHHGVPKSVLKVCDGGEICSTLENSLFGYVLSGLEWCKTMTPGAETIMAPNARCDPACTSDKIVTPIWKAAMQTFARTLTGNVFVMLDGTNVTPYDEKSAFATDQIASIDDKKVTEVTVYLTPNLDDPSKQTDCENESVQILKKAIEKKKIKYECVVAPKFIKQHMCISKPELKACKLESRGIVTNPASLMATTLTMVTVVPLVHLL